MSIKFLNNLISQKKDNLESDNIVLLKELPFYGVAGSIYRIEEAPDCYYKVLYNQDGSINSRMIPVPKKRCKNLGLVVNDYIEDVKKYLKVFNDKYIDYSNDEIKPILNNREFYILFVIYSCCSVAYRFVHKPINSVSKMLEMRSCINATLVASIVNSGNLQIHVCFNTD